MEIAGIKSGDLTGYQISGKASSKKSWELSDSLKEQIIEYAKEDAARNVYMGDGFLSLRRSVVAKVAPDRSGLIGKINGALSSDNMEHMKKIKEADEKWLNILFGKTYKAKIQSEGTGSAIHLYEETGEEILTYTEGVGWHEKESKAESEVHGALKAAYYKAYHDARQGIKGGGLDIIA